MAVPMPSPDVNTITEKIIGCAYRVSNSLGIGFVEKVYENALAHDLQSSSLKVVQQAPIKVMYVLVGEFFADLLVEDLVLVELKAVSMLMDEHVAQSLNYLRATGLEICLLINFGTTKVQLKRLRRSVNWKIPTP
jgi:GxxExxY protein